MSLRFSKSLFLLLLMLLMSTSTYTYPGRQGDGWQPIGRTATDATAFVPFSMGQLVSGFIPDGLQRLPSPVVPAPAKSFTIDESIMGSTTTDIARMARFLLRHNTTVDSAQAYGLAEIYRHEADFEGVNATVAFVQMCLETGFLRFDGTVQPGQHNYCGLGVTGKGVQGLVFATPQMGVRAHIQHLKAYASDEALRGELVDTRFRFVKRRSATSLKELTGKWAADRQYDVKLRNLLHRLHAS